MSVSRSISVVPGTRIRFRNEPIGEILAATVTEVCRREGKRRTIYYRIAEDSAAEIDKADVIELSTPQMIVEDIVEALLDTRVLENIELSRREVRRHAEKNSPYLPTAAAKAPERCGGIRI